MRELEVERLCDLLRHLEDTNTITKPETKVQAQLCPHESCEVSIWFTVKTGLTISKYRKFKYAMEKKFPWIKLKKIYNKHIIMIYYTYERY